MGVPYYFYVLSRTYPGIITDVMPKDIAHFFIDYNAMIHPIAHQVMGAEAPAAPIETTIIKQVWQSTTALIADVKATAGVYLCVDGVAPFAKMMQQRARRFLSTMRPARPWDTNAISPGTPFMAQLGKYIQKKIGAGAGAPIIFSGADQPGEGEHKIFAMLGDAPGKTLIHGMDADLIMLSLLAGHPGITLMRAGGGPADPQYLNIDALRSAIIDHVASEYKWEICGVPENLIIEKYVILCFLLGNDFVPHLACLSLKNNGYDHLLRAAPKEAITDIYRLVLPIFQEMSRSEDVDMWRLCENYSQRAPRGPPEEHIPYKDPIALRMIRNPKWRDLYYSHLFYDKDSIPVACAAYIKGLYWIQRYYTRQLKNDYTWHYPYAYAPTIKDLYNYMSSMRVADIAAVTRSLSARNAEFVSPEVQLMTIMPLQSLDILPKKVQKKMTSPKMAHMYPEKFKVHTFLKTYLWECSPILPFMATA